MLGEMKTRSEVGMAFNSMRESREPEAFPDEEGMPNKAKERIPDLLQPLASVEKVQR
jgi:hypothetical protein